MHGQVAAVAVQMQHRAFDLDTLFGRQPPAVQLEAVGGGQGDVAVFEFGFFRGEQLAGLGVEQQRAATAQGQEKAEECRGFSSVETSQKWIGIHPVDQSCGSELARDSGVSANRSVEC